MADYNSTLPIVGSVTVESSTLVGVSGDIFDSGDLTGSMSLQGIGSVHVANILEVSGAIFDGGDLTGSMSLQGVGSVHIANILEVSGAIFDSGDITGSVVVSDSVRLGVSGTVDIGNTVSVSAGAREDLVVDYQTDASVAAAAIGSHGYVSLGSLYVSRIIAGFSGKGKVVVLTSGTSAVPLAVGFNSTANPNINMDFGESNGLFFGLGSVVVLTMTNRDSAAQDIYSTIIGYHTYVD